MSLQLEKLKLRDAKGLAQGHTAVEAGQGPELFAPSGLFNLFLFVLTNNY